MRRGVMLRFSKHVGKCQTLTLRGPQGETLLLLRYMGIILPSSNTTSSSLLYSERWWFLSVRAIARREFLCNPAKTADRPGNGRYRRACGSGHYQGVAL